MLKSLLVLALKFNYIFITHKVFTIFHTPINNPIKKSIIKPINIIFNMYAYVFYITNQYYFQTIICI